MANKKVKKVSKVYIRKIARKMLKYRLRNNKIRNYWRDVHGVY